MKKILMQDKEFSSLMSAGRSFLILLSSYSKLIEVLEESDWSSKYFRRS